VYCDYEAITDAEGNQTPIILCLEDDDEDQFCSFYGPNCTADMFDHLESLAVDVDGDDREVIVLFHNLKGYDGMFILQHCYATYREVTDQITVGTKILSLRSDRLTFKDALCFLPFPLANFPATFGINELCKGFFPHKFNTLENQEYEGPMPPRDMYDPDGMSAKKKAEFERWYGGKRKSTITTISYYDKKWKPTASRMSNSSKQAAKSSDKNSNKKLTSTPWRNASPSHPPDGTGPIQSVLQSPEMASLARTLVTTHRPKRSYPYGTKRR